MKQYLYLVVVALFSTTGIKAMYSDFKTMHKAYSELLQIDQPPLATNMTEPFPVFESLHYTGGDMINVISTIFKEFGINHIIAMLKKLSEMHDNLNIQQLTSLGPAHELRYRIQPILHILRWTASNDPDNPPPNNLTDPLAKCEELLEKVKRDISRWHNSANVNILMYNGWIVNK